MSSSRAPVQASCSATLCAQTGLRHISATPAMLIAPRNSPPSPPIPVCSGRAARMAASCALAHNSAVVMCHLLHCSQIDRRAPHTCPGDCAASLLLQVPVEIKSIDISPVSPQYMALGYLFPLIQLQRNHKHVFSCSDGSVHMMDRRMASTEQAFATLRCPTGRITSALFSRLRDQIVVCGSTDVCVFNVHDTSDSVAERLNMEAHRSSTQCGCHTP